MGTIRNSASAVVALGVLLAWSSSAAAQSGNSALRQITVTEWKRCPTPAAEKAGRCGSEKVRQHVKVYDTDGKVKQEMDLSALQLKPGLHDFHTRFNIVLLPELNIAGGMFGVPAVLVQFQFCKATVVAGNAAGNVAGVGSRPTARAGGLGSGEGCPQ